MNWEDRTADYYIQRMFRQWDMADFASEMEVERVYRRLAGDLICRLTQRLSFKINEELGGEVVKKIVIT